ncbi:nucleotidyltransferase family protein [Nodosilinea sp. PGN35]|uniref:nucleotidyltransferase family protein n=1 Tax=Nodosilinea sp. PGN35 TaxID=3020489 RepID=UPI0023B28C4D|nr:nucleotidyltransferase domain-containing protein [Nodosilinea sp. TSF1-S3]MDF0368973.1 nucleotidyltransferase domain-containing protein [Nodosilinea sp. TSF1-S3]
MAKETLKRGKVLEMLHQLKPVLAERYGVTRLGIFGSVARDQATDISDVDVVVEMAPDLFAMVHVKEHLQSALQVPVDIVRYRVTMNQRLKQRIDQEAVYV